MVGETEQHERFAYALQQAMDARKLSARQLAKDLGGIDPRLIARWLKGKDLPNLYQADALESDYVLVESVDKTTYDEAANVITIKVTSDYVSLYQRDKQEWRDDTWEIFRDYSREIWQTVRDGIGEEISGQPINWPAWTPALTLAAGGGLRTTCPGKVIVAIGARQADQGDFEKGCTFRYK